MPIVLRYVNSKQEIHERFVKFVDYQEGVTGLTLANNVEATLEDIGLPLQGCDGASAMSSQLKGVSGENPKALYVHCSSHCLNLVVAKACDS